MILILATQNLTAELARKSKTNMAAAMEFFFLLQSPEIKWLRVSRLSSIQNMLYYIVYIMSISLTKTLLIEPKMSAPLFWQTVEISQNT